ncbi:MAG: TIGR03087 family PEP-CTERM/XrtA system glycosyltransferase [Rhodothalassiaceae bacterium]
MTAAAKSILYVTHRFPYPPAGGAKVRAFHCLRHLAACHHVTVAAPLRTDDAAEAARGLAEAAGVTVLAEPIGRVTGLAQALAHAGTYRPASMGYFRSGPLLRRIARHLADQPCDLIIVHSSSVGPAVEAASVPKIMDFVDMDSAKWRDYAPVKRFPLSLVYAREAATLRRAEARLARRFDLCLLATAFEEQELHRIAGDDVPAAVVRNGVDLDFFAPSDMAYDPDLIAFVGRMDYFPNEQAAVRFCDEVWPHIKARRPGARFRIVGAAPTPPVRALAARDGVEVTGTVADVRDHVRAAACTVVPLKIARGTQNKILESWAMGVPVVASPVAARGVDAQPGTHFLVADHARAFVEQCLQLMGQPDTRARLSQACLAHVRQTYSWQQTLRDLDAAVARALAAQRAPGGAAASTPAQEPLS